MIVKKIVYKMTNNKKSNKNKSKSSKKTIKAAPPPSKKVGVPRKMNQIRATAANVEEVCSQLDAFCNVPSKIQDESSSRSLVYMQRWAITLSTNGEGSASVWFPSPHPYLQQYCPMTVDSSGNATIVTGTYAALTAIPGAYQYRIVKCGLQVTEIGNFFQRQGVVRYCLPNSPEVTTLSAYDVNGYNYDKIYMESYGKKSIVQIPFIRFGAARPEQWYNCGNPNTTRGAGNNFSYFPLVLSVIGGQTLAPVLRIEFFCTFELNFADDNALSMLTTPAPIYRPVMSGIVKGVESTITDLVHSGAEGFKNYLKKAAIRAFQARFAPSTLALTVD